MSGLNVEILLQELLQEAEYELFHYPTTSKKENIKYIIKRIVKPAGTPKRDSFFWTHAMLASAMESAGKIDILKKYYDTWIGRGIPLYNLDNVMNGYSLLYVYEQTKEKKYEEAAHKLYAYICNYKKEMGGTLPYRKHHPKHIYVDAMGMIVPFLCRYGFIFDNKEAIELGTGYIQDFLKFGIDGKTNLPYHGYDLETRVKYGIIGWGRAVGWLMLGLADSLDYIPKSEEKAELQKTFLNLSEIVSRYLRTDGYFSWQLSTVEGPRDTSATAMIGYAIQKALQCGTVDVIEQQDESAAIDFERYKKITEDIKIAMISSIKNGKIYDCSGECEGFSQYPQVYGAYPWSLGPGIRLLALKSSN